MLTVPTISFRHGLHANTFPSPCYEAIHLVEIRIILNHHQRHCTCNGCSCLRGNRVEVSEIKCHLMTLVIGITLLNTRPTAGRQPLQPRISEGCALSVSVPCWPSSCNRTIREREGYLRAPRSTQDSAAPVQEGEMRELFIKRKSSQA